MDCFQPGRAPKHSRKNWAHVNADSLPTVSCEHGGHQSDCLATYLAHVTN